VLPPGFGFEVDPKPQDQHRSWARYLNGVRVGLWWKVVVVGGGIFTPEVFRLYVTKSCD